MSTHLHIELLMTIRKYLEVGPWEVIDVKGSPDYAPDDIRGWDNKAPSLS